ncbi:MAG: AAA family ATPase [Cyanobacteria bacterium J06642_9]
MHRIREVMDDEEFQAVLRYVAETLQQHEGRGLKRTECCVLLAAWKDLRYEDVPGFCPEECSYSPGTLQRDAAPKLWKSLKKAWHQQRLTKYTFRSTVETLMFGESQPLPSPSPEINSQPSFSTSTLLVDPIVERQPLAPPSPPKRDIQELTCDNPAFYGRTQELAKLQPILTANHHRLVVLNGPSGSGKTWLLGKLLRDIPADRPVFYRRANRVTKVADLYREFMAFLQVPIDSTHLPNESTLVDQLIRQLGQERYLIVLDQAEELDVPLDVLTLRTGERDREKQGYPLLLDALTERYHRSCVVWVSRVRPNLLGTDNRYFEATISGFTETDALQWLTTIPDLEGAPQTRQELVTLCAGNPELLQGAVNEIRRFHNGNIEHLLKPENLESLTRLSDRLLSPFRELLVAEQAILYWLALSPQPRQKLRERLKTAEQNISIGWVLRSLTCRHLIVEDPASSLIDLTPPLLRPLILERLATIVSQEVLNCRPQLLHSHPILLATAAEQARQTHNKLIVQAIVRAVRYEIGTDLGVLKQALEALLGELRQYPQQRSYAAGNLINLAIALNLDLRDWELTELRIAQADLRQNLVRSVNFARAQLEDIVFTAGLRGDICGAISADGNTLVIGDATGGVWVWQYTPQQRLALINFLSGDGHPVKALAFCPDSGALVVANDQGQVQFYWDVLRSSDPMPFEMDHPSPVTCLQVSPDGVYLAAGRQDGAIVIWECATGLPKQVFSAHSDSVHHLTFSPADLEARYLISCGDDSKTFIWDIDRDRPIQTIHSTAYYTIRATLCPARERVLWAEYNDRSIHIASLDQTPADSRVLSHTGDDGDYVVTVAFSPNGRFLASSGQNRTVQIWDLSQPGQAPLQTLSGFEQSASVLVFSGDGQILLTRTRFGITLWETLSGKPLRKFTSLPITSAETDQPFYAGLNLKQVQGLSEVEKRILARQGAIL